MKWLIISGIVGAVIVSSIFGYLYFNGTPLAHKAAKQHAVDFVSFEYTVDEEHLHVTSTSYSSEHKRYSVQLENLDEKGQNYEVAVRMDGSLESTLILDVTGQYDEFGMAYCH
ncbi:hypothetical protein [Alteribacter populi]|uniref:YfjL-like protein n=1 Tax=Alteribacter populi TaxID=2011011 RepID=UPI000BBB3D2F|nr:hypothetical protein [Alteribacter populi]